MGNIIFFFTHIIFPKVVYQNNGRAFKSKYFQIKNLDEARFNGVYANLGIESVFAKVRNAQAKVIERFFLEFQGELEIPVYNTEKYWVECIDSVLSQTFTDLDVILVNDALPDWTPLKFVLFGVSSVISLP